MKVKTLIKWVLLGVLFAGACALLLKYVDEFKTKYTEPEIIQENVSN